MGKVKQMYIDELESIGGVWDEQTDHARTDWEWEQEKADIDQVYAEWLRDHSNIGDRDSI